MTGRMNGGQIERLLTVRNGDCPERQSETSRSGLVRRKAESAESVSVCVPEGWLDRIQVGFPQANWW